MYYRLRFSNEPYRYDTLMHDEICRDFNDMIAKMSQLRDKFRFVRIQVKG